MAVIDEGKAPTYTALGKALGVAKQTVWASWPGTPTSYRGSTASSAPPTVDIRAPWSAAWAWSAPPAAAPGPVAERSPWTEDSSPESDSDDDGDRTTQLPAVDSASRTESETDDHTRELPRTDREP